LEKPIIGITIGDPAGVGAEIAVKAALNNKVLKSSRPCVIGCPDVVKMAVRLCGLDSEVKQIQIPDEADYRNKAIYVVSINNIDIKELKPGEIHPLCGKAAFDYIQKGVELALCGKINALTTAPINKKSLKEAGIKYTDHTEALAALTGTVDAQTMFQVGKLKIFFLSRHISLRDAINLISEEEVYKSIKKVVTSMKMIGCKNPIIAVAGLNPHCGENGLFGNEEILYIKPAVERAQKEGIKVEGPFPSDSVFYLCIQGKFDAVLSLYHDQGHIAAKTYNFKKTISLTLGLPFLRTSVDHGTAFNIAGKGIADHTSMVQAILAAARYASFYRYNFK